MGEYATYKGEQVKIGTCEDFYYLRADQRHLVDGYGFDGDLLAVTRFRFPFPDEDTLEPGQFEDYSRGVKVPGYTLPAELSGDAHGSVQFTSRAGYVLSIPCPEMYAEHESGSRMSTEVEIASESGTATLHVFRNGFNGQPVLVQQAFRGGHLVSLLHCGACGAMHRLDTLEDARPVIDAFRAEAEREEWRRTDVVFPEGDDYPKIGSFTDAPTYGNEPAHSETYRAFLRAIADRIEAGYVRESVTA